MAERRRKTTRKWSDLKARMSPEARARVDAQVRESIAAMPLADIRKAIGQTQQELAARLGVAQGSVSKVENAADLYLSTLRKYVEALGGELRLTATFPDGRQIDIDRLPDLRAG